MPKRKATKKKKASRQTTIVAVGWYTPEQWERLREVAADRDELEATYEEWRLGAEKTLRKLQRLGVRAEKFDVDVKDLMLWCKEHGFPNNPAARAEYVADKLARSSSATQD